MRMLIAGGVTGAVAMLFLLPLSWWPDVSPGTVFCPWGTTLHVGLCGVAAAAWGWALREVPVWLLLMAGLAFAGMMEAVQHSPSGERSPETLHFLYNSIGVVWGLIVGLSLPARARKREMVT